MKKIRQYNSTQETILDAANRVLTVKGAEGFTLDRVAAEAGISKGGLLYHFPTKNSLIEGMIVRSIARVDTALKEELEASGGDHLEAYIRASFRTTVEPEQVSRVLFAAVASSPDLLEPLRAHFEQMQNDIIAAAPSAEVGTLIRLCMDGLWYSEIYNFAPPPKELREQLQNTLLSFVRNKSFEKDNNCKE